MIYSTKYSYSSSLSCKKEYQYSASGDGGGCVDPSTNHYGGFWPYNSHCTELPLVSSLIGNYQVGSADGSSFGITSGDDRYGIGPSNTHFSSHKVTSYLSS